MACTGQSAQGRCERRQVARQGWRAARFLGDNCRGRPFLGDNFRAKLLAKSFGRKTAGEKLLHARIRGQRILPEDLARGQRVLREDLAWGSGGEDRRGWILG